MSGIRPVGIGVHAEVAIWAARTDGERPADQSPICPGWVGQKTHLSQRLDYGRKTPEGSPFQMSWLFSEMCHEGAWIRAGGRLGGR